VKRGVSSRQRGPVSVKVVSAFSRATRGDITRDRTRRYAEQVRKSHEMRGDYAHLIPIEIYGVSGVTRVARVASRAGPKRGLREIEGLIRGSLVHRGRPRIGGGERAGACSSHKSLPSAFRCVPRVSADLDLESFIDDRRIAKRLRHSPPNPLYPHTGPVYYRATLYASARARTHVKNMRVCIPPSRWKSSRQAE